MSKKKISVEDFEKSLSKIFDGYREEVVKVTNEAVDKTTKEVDEEIRNHITFNNRTGNYIRSFATKNLKTTKTGKVNMWYVKSPYYRLTHLLEKGHRAGKGGKSRAFPHIKYGAKIAKINLNKHIKEGLEK